jgi:hypothetical protein
MTRLASDAGQDVTFVGEPHEVWEIVHAEPPNRLLPFPVSEKLDDLRLVRGDRQVALGAALNRREASNWTAARVCVAQLTRNRIVASMEAMAEGDRLCGVLGAQAGKKCEESAENERERRRTQSTPHLTAAIILRENPPMNRNAGVWFFAAIVVFGLAVLAVVFGLHLVPPRETAAAKGTIVPWYLVWGMISATAAMAVFLAGFLASMAFNAGKRPE